MREVRSSGRFGLREDPWPLLLFLVAFVLAAPVHVRYLVPLDEGALVHVAERLAGGEVLYRDVATGIMPGTYYLLALLFEVFGVSLTVGRVLQMILLAASTALIYGLSRRFGERPAATLAAVTYFSVSLFGYRYPNYSPLAVLLILLGVGFFLRALDASHGGRLSLATSGALLGVAFLTKQNYGATVYAALFGALVLGALLRRERASWASVAIFGGAFLAPVALTVGAFALAGAGDEMFDYTVASLFSETLGSFYKPFPLLAIREPFFFLDDLYNYFPFPPLIDVLGGEVHRGFAAVLIGATYLALPAVLLGGIWRVVGRLGRPAFDLAELAIVLAALALFTGAYPRSDFHHLTLVCSLPLVVAVMITRREGAGGGTGAGRWRLRVGVAGLALFALASAVPPLLGLFVDFPERQSTRVGLPRAGLLRLAAYQADEMRGLVEYVAEETIEDEPILVIPDDPLYYFLADRPNPTPYPLVLPGSFDEDSYAAALREVDVVLFQDLAYDGTPVAQLFPSLGRQLSRHFEPDERYLDRLESPGLVPVYPLRRSETARSREGLLLIDLPSESRIVDVEGGVQGLDSRGVPRVRTAPWLTESAWRLRPPSGWQKLVHSVRVDVPADARLELSPAVLPAPRGETADGAVLEVYAHDLEAGETTRVYATSLDPREPRSWRPKQEVVDLAFLGGREAILSFSTHAGARLEEAFDIVVVAEPRLIGSLSEKRSVPVVGDASMSAAIPGQVYEAIRRFDDPEVFEQATRATPDDPLAQAHLGLVLARTGRVDRAIEALRRAEVLDPSLADVQLALAEVLAAQGRWKEACGDYADLLALDPRSVRALTKLGDCALDLDGDLARARRMANLAKVRAPDSLDVLLLQVRIALAAGEVDLASPLLVRALELSPGHPYLLEELNRVFPGQRVEIGGHELSRGAAGVAREAFEAALHPVVPVPERVVAGSLLALSVEVENRGGANWASLGSPEGNHRFALGLRWIDARGESRMESRVALPYDLAPGDRVVLVSQAPVPPAGSYQLEVAMVEGPGRWWNELAGEHLKFSVEVE